MFQTGETGGQKRQLGLLGEHRCLHPGGLGHPPERPGPGGDHQKGQSCKYALFILIESETESEIFFIMSFGFC